MNGVPPCATCRRPLTVRTYVTQGFLGTYIECEYCFAGVERPPELELITDSFTVPQPQPSPSSRSLDRILDKLTGDAR